jgi:hypothetical protein
MLTLAYQVRVAQGSFVIVEWYAGTQLVQNGGTTYTPGPAVVGRAIQVKITIYQMPFAPVMGWSNAVSIV